MQKIAIIGAGYVGLVTGACFAERGHDVVCIDSDHAKIESLRRGRSPISRRSVEAHGFEYFSVGRPDLKAAADGEGVA